jgi:macrodomain Ter protein organizer (MatP/YcbG family)
MIKSIENGVESAEENNSPEEVADWVKNQMLPVLRDLKTQAIRTDEADKLARGVISEAFVRVVG